MAAHGVDHWGGRRLYRNVGVAAAGAEAGHMKITGVRTVPYQLTMQRPIADANYPVGSDQMPGLAVYIDTDEGITGISWAVPVT